MIWDSAAKGAECTEVCLLSMWHLDVVEKVYRTVINSPSAGFVTSVTSDVALALCSDGVGSISIVSSSGV